MSLFGQQLCNLDLTFGQRNVRSAFDYNAGVARGQSCGSQMLHFYRGIKHGVRYAVELTR
jgi:hypothetical protein